MKELKGFGVSKGKTTGQVKIIKENLDNDKLSEGDILVTKFVREENG